MTNGIRIKHLRLSFLWAETAVEEPTKHTVLSNLRNRPRYEQWFDQAQQGRLILPGYTLPWPKPSGHYFWTYYLEGRPPGNINGNRAWKHLLPFRRRGIATLKANWLPGYAEVESWYYPFGFGLVVDITCRCDVGLRETVEKAFEIRRNDFQVSSWMIGPTALQTLTLDGFASEAMERLREETTGSKTMNGIGSVEPFSIVTVVQASGVNPAVSINDVLAVSGETGAQWGLDVHRALEAMAAWRQPWPDEDGLPPLSDVSLPLRRAPSGHVLYASRRGRVVWFPSLFTKEPGQVRTLSCYHRNLTAASLQVEILRYLMKETDNRIVAGKTLTAAHRDWANRAVGILGRLHGGISDTYRNWSLCAQIEQKDHRQAIDRVRGYFHMGPLF